MGIGQIPFTSCDTYASRFGIVGVDDFERFLRLIRGMDRVYLKEARDKQERERPRT